MEATSNDFLEGDILNGEISKSRIETKLSIDRGRLTAIAAQSLSFLCIYVILSFIVS